MKITNIKGEEIFIDTKWKEIREKQQMKATHNRILGVKAKTDTGSG
jgi:hypothetical protein